MLHSKSLCVPSLVTTSYITQTPPSKYTDLLPKLTDIESLAGHYIVTGLSFTTSYNLTACGDVVMLLTITELT